MSSPISSRLSCLLIRGLTVRVLCLVVALARSANSLSRNVNTTSLQATITPYRTSASSNASMCAVAQNGLSPIADGPPAPEDFSTACSCSNLIRSFASDIPSPYLYRDTLSHTLTDFVTFTTITQPHYLPPEDCCVACWVTARDVQVFYWPADTDTKRPANQSVPITQPTSQSLISNGITFISPSVYVAYRNLRRSDNCPSFGWGDFTRGPVYNTTIAYNPGFLSTSMCTGEAEGFYQGFAALNITDLQYPISHNGTCQGLDISVESTTNGPYLSMPPALTGLDPAWSTCNAVYWGAFDPPIALHTATALAPDPGTKSPPTPAPGSPVIPPHAPPTPTPTSSLLDPVKPERPSSAPNGTPKDPEQQDPNSPDPIKPLANTPRPDPQDPNVSNNGPPDPVQTPANDNNDGPAALPTLTKPLNEGNAAQGNSRATSDPESNDPQRAGDVSEGDPGADPSNESNTGNGDNAGSGNNSGDGRYPGNGNNAGDGNNASPTSDPANNVKQGPADRVQPLPSIGGHQVQAASGGGIVIASTTLLPGLQTTIDGTPLSVDKDRIVIASSTIPLAPPPSTADPSITLINGDVISAGGPAAIVSGTTVAFLAPNDDDDHALVVNGHTSPFAQPLPTPVPVLTVAGQTLTPAPAGFAVGTQSVLPGRSAVVVDGSTLSLASNALVVNGKTTPLPTSSASPVFRIGSQTFTAAPTGFAVGAQTVSPGGPAVFVDGTTLSLAPPSSSGSNALLVINGKTTPLPPLAPTSIFKVGSQIFTAAPTGFAVGAQNVRPGGPAVTVDDTVVSLDASSELILDGSSTVPLVLPTQGDEGALGSLIMGGLGGARATSNSSSANGSDGAAAFFGEGEVVRGSRWMGMLTLGVWAGVFVGGL